MRTKTLEQNSAQKFAGLQIDLLQKLRNGNMEIAQFEWFNNLTFEQRQRIMNEQKMGLIKLISGEETLILDAVDGSQTIYTSRMFHRIDDILTGGNARMHGVSTKETNVQVYELQKSATPLQMFSCLMNDLSRLCLTQHQIENFISKYKSWLSDEHGNTFFLFESNSTIFLACIVRVDDRLLVDIKPLYEYEWDHLYSNGEYGLKYRLIVPTKS